MFSFKKCIGLSGILFLFHTTAALANGLLTVTASINNTWLRSDSQTMITYTVTNTTRAVQPNLKIQAQDGDEQPIAGTSLLNDNCSGQSLAHNASCTFQMTYSGANLSKSLTVAPAVCPNGSNCSRPNSANRTFINLVNVASETPTAYLGLQTSNVLQPIIAATEALGSTVSGFDFASKSQGVAVSLDGTRVYVASGNSNAVMVLNNTGTILATINHTNYSAIPASFDPVGVAVSPDGTMLYMADNNSSNHAAYVFNVSTNMPAYVTTVTLSGMAHPHGIAVSPDGKTIYVVNSTDTGSGSSTNTGAAINASTYAVTYFAMESFAIDVIVSPDNSQFYVSFGASDSDAVEVFNAKTVTATYSFLMSGQSPHGLALSPDGQTLYVADYGDSGTGTGVSFLTNLFNIPPTLSTTVTVDSGPTGVAVTPDGSKVYTSIQNTSKVDVININNGNSVDEITVANGQRNQGRFVG